MLLILKASGLQILTNELMLLFTAGLCGQEVKVYMWWCSGQWRSLENIFTIGFYFGNSCGKYFPDCQAQLYGFTRCYRNDCQKLRQAPIHYRAFYRQFLNQNNGETNPIYCY
jgi:hypothetical protein